jgi:FlaA1/EpsC-like NDP-sugar epimerase
MGEPVKVLDLARTLIRLSGKSEEEVGIRFVGLREGEKLNEELFYAHEQVIPTSCQKIKRTRGPRKEWFILHRQLNELRASMTVDGAAPILAMIKKIVPEFTSTAKFPEIMVSDPAPERYLQKAAGGD